MKKQLYAGAGTAEILFDDFIFPIEGLNGTVHDNPHVRILILESNIKVAIVAFEIVNASTEAIALTKKKIASSCDIDEFNVWVHSTHAITTMHAPAKEADNLSYLNSIDRSVTEALEKALQTFQPASMGIETSELDINTNRDIKIGDAWFYGMGGTLPSNKTLTIIRFNGLDQKPICLFISYGLKPDCVSNIGKKDNKRMISADVPGVACSMLEQATGAPSMFCMPAAADQLPKIMPHYFSEENTDENGVPVLKELELSKAFEIMEKQGKLMGEACISLSENIMCTETCPEILSFETSFKYPNRVQDGQMEITINAIQLGENVVLIGLRPETNSATEIALKAISPYTHTLLITFLNGDQKYMPDKDVYPLNTWEVKRAGASVGCAEKFVEIANKLLSDIKAGTTLSYKKSSSSTYNQNQQRTYEEIDFGNIQWYILKKTDEYAFLLSKYVLEKKSYHSSETPVTWEKSAIRDYLNNEFLYSNFTPNEQSHILATHIDNISNGVYGVPGGSPTTDKVFLMSLAEAEEYLTGSDIRFGYEKSSSNSIWWQLRSPGEAGAVNASITASGLIDYHGVCNGVANPDGGIRPCIRIQLD